MNRRHGRRAASPLLALAVVGALASAAGATPTVTTRRLFGNDRYGTAQAVSSQTFDRATAPIIATGLNFPDALAASYLAGGGQAPILLTPTGSLAPEAAAALTALGSTGVVIVGGTDAVSTVVENDLRSRNLVVQRIFGGDRYATAKALAESQPATGIGIFPGQGRTAIVASGDNFPDALAGGPLAYSQGYPLLLTPKDTLSPLTSASLTNLGIRHVLLLGGADAVSDATASQIQGLGIIVRRVSGGTRAATAAAVADLAVAQLGYGTGHVNLARGDEFPDALTGGSHGGSERRVLLLTANRDILDPATESFLTRNAAAIDTIDIFGGTLAITDATAAAARRAAGGT